MVQFLPEASDGRRPPDLPPGDAPEGVEIAQPAEDEAWAEARALAGTVEDHELVDPLLSSERLLYRLFHERGVTVFEPRAIRDSLLSETDPPASFMRGNLRRAMAV
jgi:molecular chaperone Hsp33